MKHRIPFQALVALALLAGCGPRSLGTFGHHADDCPSGKCPPEQKSDASDGSVLDAAEVPGPSHDANISDAGIFVPECKHASECDDQDVCNGVFDCVAGECKLVIPGCDNPDALHCESSCEITNGERICGIRPRDADHDSYGDSACKHSSLAALDCNDGDPNVHPEVAELCDGIDNDCNGRVDLEDGLPLPGQNEKFAFGQNPVLVATTQNSFGAAYSTTAGHVTFYSFKHTGEILYGFQQIVWLERASDRVVPALAWGHDLFGLAWSRNNVVRFLELGITGQPTNPYAADHQDKQNVNPAGVNGNWASVTAVGKHDWLVVYDSPELSRLTARRITPNGKLDPVHVASGAFEQPVSLLTSEQGVAGAWARSEGNQYTLEWTQNLDIRLADGGVGEPTPDGGVPDGGGVTVDIGAEALGSSDKLRKVNSAVIAKRPGGYGVTWAESPGTVAFKLHFAEFDDAGKPLCGPIEVEMATGERSALSPSSMVAVENGYVIAGSTWRADGSLYGVFATDVVVVSTLGGCHYSQRFRIAEPTSANVAIARASKTGEFLLLYQAPIPDSVDYIFKHMLPPNLCAVPAPAPP